MSKNKSLIQHQDAFRQTINYYNMGVKKTTIQNPTDIDGFIEYHDKAMIFFEVKQLGKFDNEYFQNNGQCLALMRLVDACTDAGKQAICFFCVHSSPSEREIILEKTLVQYVYTKKEGIRKIKKRKAVTAKKSLKRFIKKVDR